MARTSKIEACMLCGEVPCACNQRVSRPRSIKVPAPVEPEQVRPPTRAVAAMKNAARTSRRERLESAYTVPTGAAPAYSEDAVLAAALRAIGPIMHETERARYRVILTSQPSVGDRASAWRGRHVSGN